MNSTATKLTASVLTAMLLMASCGDKGGADTPPIDPVIELSINATTETESTVLIGFDDQDGEVVNASYTLIPEVATESIDFTSEELSAANSENGLQKVFENLEADTKYTLSITATDNDERTVNKDISFTTEPEPTKTYTIETTVTPLITKWNDAEDGNVLPSGTVIAELGTQVEVEQDGEAIAASGYEVDYDLTDDAQGKLHLQGNQLVVTNDLTIDDPITGETINGNTDDLAALIKTTVRNGQGKVLGADNNQAQLDLQDTKTVHFFDAINGDDTYLEKNNGQLYQKAKNARNLYVQYEANGESGSYLGSANLQDMAEGYENLSAELTENGVMTIKFLPASADGAPKYLTTKQLQQIMTAIDDVSATNILNNWESYVTEYGNVLNQLTADDVTPLVFNSGTVSPILVVIKPEKAKQLVMSLITNFEEAHAANMF